MKQAPQSIFWFLIGSHFPSVENAFKCAIAARAESPEPNSKRPTMDYWGDEIQQMRMEGNVAVIPVKGPLIKGATGSDKRFGFASYEDVHEDLATALSNKASGIVLDISSPGGGAVGCGQLAARVAEIVAGG